MDDQRLIIALGGVLHGMGWPCLPLPALALPPVACGLAPALPAPVALPPVACGLAAGLPAPAPAPALPAPVAAKVHPFYSCPKRDYCDGGPDCVCLEEQRQYLDDHVRDIHGNFIVRR